MKKVVNKKEEIINSFISNGLDILLLVLLFAFCFAGWHLCSTLECKEFFNNLFLGDNKIQ